MKTAIRWLIYWGCVLVGSTGEFACGYGTRKFRFFNWLYDGDAEPEFDVIMPDAPEINRQEICDDCGKRYWPALPHKCVDDEAQSGEKK